MPRTKSTKIKPLDFITPVRTVQVGGSGANVSVPDYGVAVVGNAPTNAGTGDRGKAIALMGGIAIAGDGAEATSSKNSMAISGGGGQAIVGDGAMAKAASEGLAFSYLRSTAAVDDRAWAVAFELGVAIARAGVAETVKGGLAGAMTVPSADGGNRGIAIAGDGGVAFAFDEGVVLKAGRGGLLVGFWNDETGYHVASQPIGPPGTFKANIFYRFQGGNFLKLSDDEAKATEDDVATWKKPWREVVQREIRRRRTGGE